MNQPRCGTTVCIRPGLFAMCNKPAMWINPRWACALCDRHKQQHEFATDERWERLPARLN